MNKPTRTVLACVLAAATITTTAAMAGAHEQHTETSLELTRRQERLLIQATKQYRSPEGAIADGYVPSDVCVELPGVGGMGHHYVKPQLIDNVVEPTRPEILVYVGTREGELRLGALEYFVPDADQDVNTDDDRPVLFGHPFDGPMPGHEPGMPIHYDLHVWLFKHNPAGTLATWNPKVTCPS